MLWNKTYGTATDSDYLTTIAVAPDGGYIMAGAKYLDVSGTGQAWALKVDSQGIVQWSKTFPDTHANVFWGVTVTSDGSYAFAGQKYGGSSDDLWAVKLDSNGNLLWSKTFGGSESEVGWWILQNKDGSFTLSGTTASYGAGKNDFCLVNINQNGALQWSQTYGGPEDEIGYVLAATPDGGYAMVGSTLSYGTAGSSDFWLIKTDKNGKLLWNQTMGGPDYDQGQCLTVSQDGVYSIAGTTASYGAGATDGWLIVSDAFEPTTAAPSSTPMQASMQAIFVLIFAVIMAVISLMIVSKRREQPH
jgi:hypothetical protein